MEMCFRVLAYTQIGTFILVVMSLSWLFSTFLYPALLSTWGLGAGDQEGGRHVVMLHQV